VCLLAVQATPLTRAWPDRSRFGSRTCHNRRVTGLTKLAFVWLASGARLSDDRQTMNRQMLDGIIVCFSFVSSGVRLAGTSSRRRRGRRALVRTRQGDRAASVLPRSDHRGYEVVSESALSR